MFLKIILYSNSGNVRLSRIGNARTALQPFGAQTEGSSARSTQENQFDRFARVSATRRFARQRIGRLRNICLFRRKSLLQIFTAVR